MRTRNHEGIVKAKFCTISIESLIESAKFWDPIKLLLICLPKLGTSDQELIDTTNKIHKHKDNRNLHKKQKAVKD